MWRPTEAMKTDTLEADDIDRKNGDKKGRKASKETRRQQLIEATIDSLARRGYSETTMADVADGAGLSRVTSSVPIISRNHSPSSMAEIASAVPTASNA